MNPRYEFRSFAQHFGIAAQRLRRSADCYELSETREIYFVTPDESDYNAKVRGGAIDVKQLVAHQDRLEQWKPVLEGQFPLPAEFIHDQLLAMLSISSLKVDRPEYSLTQLIEELVQRCPSLRRAHVFKRRFRFKLENDCLAEIDELLINGAAIQSMAIESEEVTSVTDAMDELRLAEYENINYPRALRRILGLESWPQNMWWL